METISEEMKSLDFGDSKATGDALPKAKESQRKNGGLVDQGRSKLRKILQDKKEYLTNVGAAVKHEEGNKIHFSVVQNQELEDIEKEAEAVSERYYELQRKTQEAVEAKGENCHKLQSLLQETTTECESILKQKDVAIQKLKNNLELRKKELSLDWDKREQDIKVIGHRLKNIISDIEKSCKSELAMINKTLEKQKQDNLKAVCSQLTFTTVEKEEKYQELKDHTLDSIRNRYSSLHQYKLNIYNDLQPIRQEISRVLHRLKLCLWETEEKLISNLGKLKYGHQLLDTKIKECRLSRGETLKNKIHYFDKQMKLKKVLLSLKSTTKIEKEKEMIQNQLKRYDKRKERGMFHHRVSKRQYDEIFHAHREEVAVQLDKLFEFDRFINQILLRGPWEYPDLSFLTYEYITVAPTEERLMKLLKSFLDAPFGSEPNIQLHQTYENMTAKRFVLQKPLNMEKFMHFIFRTLDFLVSDEAKAFAKKEYPESMDFIISTCFFPAVGIESFEDFQMFAAHVVDTATNSAFIDSVVLYPKDVVKAFEQWKVYQITHEKEKEHCRRVCVKSCDSTMWAAVRGIFSNQKSQLWNEIEVVMKQFQNVLQKHVWLLQKKKREEQIIKDFMQTVATDKVVVMSTGAMKKYKPFEFPVMPLMKEMGQRWKLRRPETYYNYLLEQIRMVQEKSRSKVI